MFGPVLTDGAFLSGRLGVELAKEVAKYARSGYEPRAKTQTTAVMVKPKKFSALWALLWFLVFGMRPDLDYGGPVLLV
jgi:hypothetical protein